MGYRTDFELFLRDVFDSINVKRIDHDSRAKAGNKPDFIVLKQDVPLLYIETKDIGTSLDKVENSEQMARYFGYANLILTDYVEFRFYRNGIPYEQPIAIAQYDLGSRTLHTIPANYDHLLKSLLDFAQSHKEPVRSGEHLAKIMGGKAQRIRDNVRQFLHYDTEKNAEIERIYKALRRLLVHDLTKEAFSDMYAQTLVYGLFVARYHDATPDHFTRQEARDLVPASNPFLRHFFDHIVGPNFDKRLEYIVNELCLVFAHANVAELMKQYFKEDLWGASHSGPDPVIHFYEDFLREYDPELRKKLGAYYTPLPVVRFIVRSVDQLLKGKFNLIDGLADSTRTQTGIHRVQVLDPAVGTGTFISATIRAIYARLKDGGQAGRWPTYVHHDLLPRIHGFELMMAPYTIAHLKLSMAFKETGFKYFNRRLGIYLTNSLEASHQSESLFTGFGFAESIAEESKEASSIKNDTPIMVVIGNPPYAGESSNTFYNGNDVYKFEPTGGKLKEKNSKWLSDDYVKFIRLAESMVERTGEGIVAMITAHGYLDNPTFRGMRHHLLKTFDEVYVLDLHGNANKKERAPDGGEDKNVFDIKTGVALFFGIRKGVHRDLGRVFRADLFGSRAAKFKFLDEHSIDTVGWSQVLPKAPNFEWVAPIEDGHSTYDLGFSVSELFKFSGVGFVTARDHMSIQFEKKEVHTVLEDFLHLDSEVLRKRYNLRKDTRDWKVELAKADVINSFSEDRIIEVSYRPFDIRWTYYTGRSKGFHCMPRAETMRHLVRGDNLALITVNRSPAETPASYVFVTRRPISNGYIRSDSVSIDSVFPLYVIAEDGSRVSNLNADICKRISTVVGEVSPEDVFDFVYAVLHAPGYREANRIALKRNFPRVPYPRDGDQFRSLVSIGRRLRDLHLLESSDVRRITTAFPNAGTNMVEKPAYRKGNVFINSSQCFGNVPELTWEFYVGGYQPLQKWLKERKGKELTSSEIEHFQHMVAAINQSLEAMESIDSLLA